MYAFVAAYLAGGFYPAEEVWERLQKRILDVHFLMLAVAVGAACIGAWAEGATLLFLFSFSGALEHYALGRTQKEIRSLFRDAPKTATVIDAADNETEVAVEKIRAGARLLIKPGAQFPVDAEIAKGNTAADESNLTGEAAPVEKNVGDTALAGTINFWGAVEVIVTRPAGGKLAAKNHHAHPRGAAAEGARAAVRRQVQHLLHLRRARACRSRCFLSGGSDFIWRRSRPAVESHSAFYRTMTLLVVSSPCALVLVHSVGGAGGDRLGRAARHSVSRRRGGGKTGRGQRRLLSTRPARSPPANCAWKKSKVFRPAAKTKSRSWPIRWKNCPRIRSPAPSRATASSRAW